MTSLELIADVSLDAYLGGMPRLDIPPAELVATADCDDYRVIHIYRRLPVLQKAA